MDKRAELTDLERRLLDRYQQGLPLSPTPYADMAAALGSTEDAVLAALGRLQRLGVVSRVGPVFRTHAVGVSTLAAMAVPEARLEAVADIVNSFAAVNHNYSMPFGTEGRFFNVKYGNNTTTPWEILGIRMDFTLLPWRPMTP